jgi:hypothetical protein
MARVIEKKDGTIQLFVHLSLKPGRDDAIIKASLFCSQRRACRDRPGSNAYRDLSERYSRSWNRRGATRPSGYWDRFIGERVTSTSKVTFLMFSMRNNSGLGKGLSSG